MNIEIANRLLEYRKKSGLSQEELAEKLNISRQSVSKWERAESCPDTDNLIELAKIYNVSLDELINGKNGKVVIEENNEVELKENNINENIIINKENNFFEDINGNQIIVDQKGLIINDGEKERSAIIPWEEVYIGKEKQKLLEAKDYLLIKKRSITGKRIKEAINGSLIFIVALTYVILCSLKVQEWSKFWVIFVSFPALCSLVDAIYYKDLSKFAFPIFIAFIYVFLGMYFSLWHPFWFLFIFIPLYYILIEAIKKKDEITYYYEGQEQKFVINHGDILLNTEQGDE